MGSDVLQSHKVKDSLLISVRWQHSISKYQNQCQEVGDPLSISISLHIYNHVVQNQCKCASVQVVMLYVVMALV